MPIAKRVDKYLSDASWIRKLFVEGRKMLGDGKGPVYDFSIGNPDLEPPMLFKDILRELAADETPGQHKYMANVGYLETRQAVASALTDEFGLQFLPEQIMMTIGAGGAINATLKALIDPGDEVILVAPFFVEYRFYVENHGGISVISQAQSNFDLDINDINEKITDKTRVVLVNNPNNPTGIVYPQKTLDLLGELLYQRSKERDRPIFLIDDGPYRKLVYDIDRCTNPFKSYDNTLMATSHSKDLCLPGERIGYLAVSPRCKGWERVISAAAFANRTLGFVNAPALMQRVVAKLQNVTIDINWYRRKRDRLFSELTRMGYRMPYPAGAFYVFPQAPGGDDVAFINKLKDMRVLVVPGSGFGMKGYFRIAYSVHDHVIEGALPVFERAISDTA
ncbi:MAG: pyridoxal phosphate-dependent aminotransferase [Proteobacteria bacterium]|nr:pyridoxal phosphate-dependent aminotransferase [Pseudomonadota bacterium]